MIERHHPTLSVGAQCQLVSISRSSFYYTPQGETALNLDLMLLIDKQFLDTPFYGVRQMTWHLQNEMFQTGRHGSSMDEGQQALAALLGLSTSVKAGPNGLDVDVGRKGARRMSAAADGGE